MAYEGGGFDKGKGFGKGEGKGFGKGEGMDEQSLEDMLATLPPEERKKFYVQKAMKDRIIGDRFIRVGLCCSCCCHLIAIIPLAPWFMAMSGASGSGGMDINLPPQWQTTRGYSLLGSTNAGGGFVSWHRLWSNTCEKSSNFNKMNMAKVVEQKIVGAVNDKIGSKVPMNAWGLALTGQCQAWPTCKIAASKRCEWYYSINMASYGALFLLLIGLGCLTFFMLSWMGETRLLKAQNKKKLNEKKLLNFIFLCVYVVMVTFAMSMWVTVFMAMISDFQKHAYHPKPSVPGPGCGALQIWIVMLPALIIQYQRMSKKEEGCEPKKAAQHNEWEQGPPGGPPPGPYGGPPPGPYGGPPPGPYGGPPAGSYAG